MSEATSHETETAAVQDAHFSDTVRLPFVNVQFDMPGGIYTFVFVLLGVLTVCEVALGSASGDWRIPILLSIAVAKAALVILYYMHLRTDSRIFAFAVGLPLLIAMLSITYLLAVPTSY